MTKQATNGLPAHELDASRHVTTGDTDQAGPQACQQALESLQASAISGHGGYGILAGQRELPGQKVVFGRNTLIPDLVLTSRMTCRSDVADMCAGTPHVRLVCGPHGFGDRVAHAADRLSRYVMIAGRGRRARSAVLDVRGCLVPSQL